MNTSFVKMMIRLILLIGLLSTMSQAQTRPANIPTTPIDPKLPTLWLVGDSTVTDSSGWGAGFAACLANGAECINYAQGGRSS